ncbi:MAG: hypothetical protein V7L31_26390 [Nostoc sp.]|uniref:hypothetical protein n=1 Tax=Nostoc sp. TaxID=1180 RepID=UPI002FF3A170
MQALPQLIGLQSLDSAIDYLPLMVVPEKSLLDAMSTKCYAYVLMLGQGESVLFSSSSQVVECFTKHDMVMLVASGTSLKTANIFEVIHNLVMTLNMSEFSETVSVLLLLYQQQLDLLAVIDNQGCIISNITPKSICEALAQKIEKTRGEISISSFEVEHQIFFERQLLKYQWLQARVIVRKDTRGKPTRLIGVSVKDLDLYRKYDSSVIQTNTPVYHIIVTQILNDVLIIDKSEAGKLEYRLTSLYRFFVKLHIIHPPVIAVPRCLVGATWGYYYVHLHTELVLDNNIVNFNLLCLHGQAVFKIQDWIIGILEEDIPYLFESFNHAINIANIRHWIRNINCRKKLCEYLSR